MRPITGRRRTRLTSIDKIADVDFSCHRKVVSFHFVGRLVLKEMVIRHASGRRPKRAELGRILLDHDCILLVYDMYSGGTFHGGYVVSPLDALQGIPLIFEARSLGKALPRVNRTMTSSREMECPLCCFR